jgi:hypothetical protein
MFRRQMLFVLIVLMCASSFSGCAYLKNRGNDAKDIFDIGITTSSKPHFAFYFDLFGILPFGAVNVDGKFTGLGRSRFGVHDFREKGYGYILGGSIQRGLGNYDVKNPDDPKWYDTGLAGYMEGKTFSQMKEKDEEISRPKARQTWPKTFHLGWIGIEVGCRFIDMVDFLAGWTTVDLGKDDLYKCHCTVKPDTQKAEMQKPDTATADTSKIPAPQKMK